MTVQTVISYVDLCLAQHGYVVTNPYHSLGKIKKNHREMFFETNYMEQDSGVVMIFFRSK